MNDQVETERDGRATNMATVVLYALFVVGVIVLLNYAMSGGGDAVVIGGAAFGGVVLWRLLARA